MTDPRRVFGLLALLGCSLLAGCAADTADPPSDDPEVDGDDAELRAARVFDCKGYDDTDTLRRFEVSLGTSKAKVTDLSKDAAAPDSGTFDPDYHPTNSTYAGSSRFLGFTKMVDRNSDYGRIDLMVSKAVMDGGSSGKMWLRFSGGHGASTSSYTCTKKAKAVAVSLSTKARFACETTPLLCGSGAPPGQTCLADLFVTQRDSGGSMRLSWFDHFGVNVSRRNETLGGATEWSRTKRTVKASWAGNELALTYRAGVTYLGKVTLADGRSTNVRCSDLAMLD